MINVMHLNHPETTPLPPIYGKTAFYEISHCAKKVEDDWSRLQTPSVQSLSCVQLFVTP